MQTESGIRVLGAVLAGGRAVRFGGDKTLALLNGRRLIDIVSEGLTLQVAGTVLCGRSLPGWRSLDDRPQAGLGPLGGLCAALHFAQAAGYDCVLSVAGDVVPVPPQLTAWLGTESNGNARAAVVAGQHLLGLWPTHLAGPLDAHLAATKDRSMHRWIAASGAVRVEIPVMLANINMRADLEQLNSAPE